MGKGQDAHDLLAKDFSTAIDLFNASLGHNREELGDLEATIDRVLDPKPRDKGWRRTRAGFWYLSRI